MVDPSAFLTKQARQGPLTVFAVICHIPKVIEVEHPYAGQTDGYSAPEDFCSQSLRLQVIRPAGTEQTEEEEDAQVAQPHITVAMLAQRVFDGTDDSESA